MLGCFAPTCLNFSKLVTRGALRRDKIQKIFEIELRRHLRSFSRWALSRFLVVSWWFLAFLAGTLRAPTNPINKRPRSDRDPGATTTQDDDQARFLMFLSGSTRVTTKDPARERPKMTTRLELEYFSGSRLSTGRPGSQLQAPPGPTKPPEMRDFRSADKPAQIYNFSGYLKAIWPEFFGPVFPRYSAESDPGDLLRSPGPSCTSTRTAAPTRPRRDPRTSPPGGCF